MSALDRWADAVARRQARAGSLVPMTNFPNLRGALSAIDVAEAELDAADAALIAAEDTAVDLADQVARAEAERDSIASAFAAHMNTAHGPVEPDPDPLPEVRQVLGACPLNSDPRQIQTSYPGAAERLFDNAQGISVVGVHTPGAARSHNSWKRGDLMNDETVARCIAPLPAQSKVTYEHEHDVKHKKAIKAANLLTGAARQAALIQADADLQRRMAEAKAFYAIVHRLRPDIDTCDVIAAGRTHSEWGDSPDLYVGRTGAKVLGIDLDGADGLVDWTKAIPRARIVADALYNGRMTCPEWGLSAGSWRLAEMKRQLPIILAAGFEEVQLFENRAFAGMELNAAERAWWREQVARVNG